MISKTLYKILGVKANASEEQIKKAYRKKVKKHHPDVGGDPEKFNQIQEAYDILSDPEKRKAYDTTGVTSTEPNNDLQVAVELVINKIRYKIDGIENKDLLTKGGLLLEILMSLKDEIKEQEQKITYEKERIGLLKILRKRMKTKKRKQINTGHEAIDQSLDYSKNGIEGCISRIKILSKALKIAQCLKIEIEITPDGIITSDTDVNGIIQSPGILNYSQGMYAKNSLDYE